MAKSFSWSFSKYKNYQTCPKKFYEVDLAKNFIEDTEQLKWGNEVHKALANACTGKAPLPDSMREYQTWVDQIRDGPGELLVEQQLAITRDLQPCAWFAHNAWFRSIVDVVRIDGSVALSWDWKTGNMKHDSRQLMLSSQALFSHYPKLKRIKTEFIWLKDDCKTPESYSRDKIVHEWLGILDGVKQMEDAAATVTYEPKPNNLCARYCPVTSCEHHGKRR